MYSKLFLIFSVTLSSVFVYRQGLGVIKTPEQDYSFGVDSLFTSNNEEGWGNYPSYFQAIGDSIRMELILTRTVSGSINWQQPSMTGTLATNLRPTAERIIHYSLPETLWEILILSNGSCYLKYLSGKLPSGNPVIIPIQANYKK